MSMRLLASCIYASFMHFAENICARPVSHQLRQRPSRLEARPLPVKSITNLLTRLTPHLFGAWMLDEVELGEIFSI